MAVAILPPVAIRVTMTAMPVAPILKGPLTRALKGSRVGTAIFSSLRTLVGSFFNTFYVLWLEVTGFMFGVFTAVGIFALFRQYRAGTMGTDLKRLWLTLGFIVICGWFTLVSFMRSKRISKSGKAR
jgi:hypothetical protein